MITTALEFHFKFFIGQQLVDGYFFSPFFLVVGEIVEEKEWFGGN